MDSCFSSVILRLKQANFYARPCIVQGAPPQHGGAGPEALEVTSLALNGRLRPMFVVGCDNRAAWQNASGLHLLTC